MQARGSLEIPTRKGGIGGVGVAVAVLPVILPGVGLTGAKVCARWFVISVPVLSGVSARASVPVIVGAGAGGVFLVVEVGANDIPIEDGIIHVTHGELGLSLGLELHLPSPGISVR